jgi:hypothetical protein
MNPIDTRLRIFRAVIFFAAAALPCGTAIGQSVQTASPPTKVTAPGPQAHQPPEQGRQPLPRGTTAPKPILQIPGPGTVEGFVYWDANTVRHIPANSCSGLAITVSVGSSSGGPLTAYTPLGTLSNNFKNVGQVKENLVGGIVKTYDVCTYGFDKVPVGPDLQVKLTVTKSAAFSKNAAPQIGTVGPVKIINAQCNMLPRVANPTSSDLLAHWASCQNMAYDVNFVLWPPTTGLTPLTASQQGGILSGTLERGMLAAKTQSQSGMLLGNRQVTPSQGGITPSEAGEGAIKPEPVATRSKASTGVDKRVLPGTRHVAVKLSSPKQSRKITNPKAELQDAAIIAVLKKQTQSAAGEAAAMKLAIRPAGVQVTGGPSQTMKAGSAGGVSAMPAPVANGPTGVIGASPGHPSPGVSGVLPPQFQNLAITCSHDSSLRVLTASGGPAPAIFTPDQKYNFYTLTGCSFGNPGTNSKVYFYYQGTFREDFQIQEWTDNWIKLSLDQNISGVDDQNDVTLVLQRDDGKQWTKSGYKFYAARQTVQLAPIPQVNFSLDHFRSDNAVTENWKSTYTSASSPSVVPNLAGLSAQVHWDITANPDGTLLGGDDVYEFSKLHSTFVLDSASMQWRDVSCSDPKDNQFAASKNEWSIDWYGNTGIRVNWQGQVCKNTPGSCGGAFQPDCFANAPESNYGINVWVSGPRGLDPWTGKPLG